MKIKQGAVAMTAERQASQAYALSVTATSDRQWVSGTSSLVAGEMEKGTFAGWSKQSAILELSDEAKEKGKDVSQKEQSKNPPWLLHKKENEHPGKGNHLADRIAELTGKEVKQPQADTK